MQEICNPYHWSGKWLPQALITLDKEASLLKYSTDEESDVCNQDCETVAYVCSQTFGAKGQADELMNALLSRLKRAKFTEYACSEASVFLLLSEFSYRFAVHVLCTSHAWMLVFPLNNFFQPWFNHALNMPTTCGPSLLPTAMLRSGAVCKKEGFYPEVPADHPKHDE